MIKRILILIIICSVGTANAQFFNFLDTNRVSNLIHIRGILMASDSLETIAFANIYTQDYQYGDYSSLDGTFELYVRPGDTITFSHVEYKNDQYFVSDSLKRGESYSILKLLTRDTINLPITKVFRMPNRQTFDYVFVKSVIADDALERARKNLNRDELRDEAMTMAMDASQNYKNVVAEQNAKIYYTGGQAPPQNIFNVSSWLQFFNAWKRGDFKSKKKKKAEKKKKSKH